MSCAPHAPRNPFSASRIRPGQLTYVFFAGQSLQRVVERLSGQGWWGAIVGPHGSGKSTLLATLAPALERAGRELQSIAFHDGARRLPAGFPNRARLHSESQVIVDGYEQLGPWARWRLKSICRRSGAGLLVTSHRSVGLPELYRTATSRELALEVVEQLTTLEAARISADEVHQRFSAHGGNLREMLFDLYDLFDERHDMRGQPGTSKTDL